MKAAVTVLGFVVLTYCGWAAAQDLPPDILADQYLLEAGRAMEQGDAQAAIRAFEKIEALDTEPPLEFLYFYGKLLVENSNALDDVLKGQSLLKQYVLSIEKTSEHYRSTLELLSMAGSKLKEINARQEWEPLGLVMIRVEGGSFTMGCQSGRDDRNGCSDNEKPPHPVQVRSFEIGKYEVTQEFWEAVMGDNPSHFTGCARCPVEEVSWDEVQIFFRKLNELSGARYRLPSEAEWEYAARGGRQSQGYQYVGSDDADAVGWHEDNSEGRTHPVGQKRANELGLYDMGGNVWEWVQDCRNDNYRGAPADGRAWERGDCSRRVVRGGSWNGGPRSVRSALRIRFSSGYRNLNLGFRIARTLTP